MKFIAVDCPTTYGSLYRAKGWDVHHYEGGFGIPIVKVYRSNNGNRCLWEAAGREALIEAMAYCRARAHTEAA